MTTSSVIVCTKNRLSSLQECIASLDAQTHHPEELVVVDASDNEATKQYIAQVQAEKPYKVVYLAHEPGLPRQRNTGIKIAKGDVLFFFDDDVVLGSTYVKTVLATFEKYRDKHIGGVSGRITPLSRNTDFAEFFFRKLFFLSQPGKGTVKFSGFPCHRNDLVESTVDILPGALMAFTKEVFEKHLFDERLIRYAYMEDVDFSYRVSRDFTLVYQPDATAQHNATTFRSADARALRRMLVRNHSYLFRKNLPHDFFHLFAHGMSIAGLLIYNLVFQKNLPAARGVLEGFVLGTVMKKGPFDG